jgi:hypothetical protein
MKRRAAVLIAVLLLGVACASTVSFKAGPFGYVLGRLSAKVESLCKKANDDCAEFKAAEAIAVEKLSKSGSLDQESLDRYLGAMLKIIDLAT